MVNMAAGFVFIGYSVVFIVAILVLKLVVFLIARVIMVFVYMIIVFGRLFRKKVKNKNKKESGS